MTISTALRLLTDLIFSFSNFLVILGLRRIPLLHDHAFKFFNIGKPILPAPTKPIN